MTPDEWLATFEARVADVQQKAATFKHDLESSGATETSPDGSLRVTVAPNGALTGLTIHDEALRHSGAELAAQIMTLTRQAQTAAAAKVSAAFAPLAGTEPEPPAQQAPPPRPRRRDDDEDFSNEQIFGGED
jgi:hypothetical protein